MFTPPPTSTLFPYTTLFRSRAAQSRSSPFLVPSRPCSSSWMVHRLGLRGSMNRKLFVGNLSFNTEERRSEEHTSELQSHSDIVCRLLLEKKKSIRKVIVTT